MRVVVGLVIGLILFAATLMLVGLVSSSSIARMTPDSIKIALFLAMLFGLPVIVVAIGLFFGVAKAAELVNELRRKLKRKQELPSTIRRAAERGDIVAFEQAFKTDRAAAFAALVPDANGYFPEHLAAMNGHVAVIEAIGNLGVQRLDRDKQGRTFLDVAQPAQAAAIEAAYCRGFIRCMLRIWKVTLDADIEALLASWVRQLLEQRNSDTTKSFVVPVSREDATDHLAEINKQVRAARDYPLALRLADATVKLTPEFYGGYMRRAQARVLAGGSSQAALADAGEAIRLAPNNAYAYEIRGAIHYELGNAAEAVADYTKAVELAPENERLKKDLDDALAKRAG